MGIFFRLSRADHSVVGGPIGSKFELVQDSLYVPIICKLKRIGSIATENKRTNSAVNAHLISGPTGSTKTIK